MNEVGRMKKLMAQLEKVNQSPCRVIEGPSDLVQGKQIWYGLSDDLRGRANDLGGRDRLAATTASTCTTLANTISATASTATSANTISATVKVRTRLPTSHRHWIHSQPPWGE
jgi:hypothetical protein